MHETRFDEWGPLLTIMAYRDEHEAIAIVNRNTTGSVCRIWCRDTPRAQAVARQMRASLVLVNDAGHGAQTRSAPCQWDVGNVLQQPRHAGFIRRQTIIGPTVTPRHTTDFNEESPCTKKASLQAASTSRSEMHTSELQSL